MLISDISVRRPVFASVLSMLLVAFGLLCFDRLPLREYPAIDPPIVSIRTNYPGAAANVVETRITEVIEKRIAGIEGVRNITSQSQDGSSRITVQFNVERDIDAAANDIRDRVSGVLDSLPDEADPPDIQKADSDDDVIMWLNLQGEGMSIIELTDYARRYLEDRFSSLDGVARVQIGGSRDISMRIWIDRVKLAARGLTVEDIENALRTENVELPAGSIESINNDFTLRVRRGYSTADDFSALVLGRGPASEGGYLVRLGDVARVEVGASEERGTLRGNGVPMVGLGIIKQSKANTLDVARVAKQEMAIVNQGLPSHMRLAQSYDSSIFIESAVREVYITLGITIVLVGAVMFAFLGSLRVTIIPFLAVPASLIGTCIILYAMGFTINLLTLLALILAIGLVVDDAIIVVENAYRRVEMGEPGLVAAFRGTRQVGFAVIATTIVLVAVFLPITLLEGDVGRLFSEFAVAMAAAVILSSFVALTLSPMLCSKLLVHREKPAAFNRMIDSAFESMRKTYLGALGRLIDHSFAGLVVMIGVFGGAVWLFTQIPSEFSPREDRGNFNILIRGPEGASYKYTMEHLDQVEKRLMPFVEEGAVQRMLMRAPGSFGTTASYNDSRGIFVMSDWKDRKPIWFYMDEARRLTEDIPGVRITSTVRRAFGGGAQKPVQFVLGGPSYPDLLEWRDVLLERARQNPGLVEIDHDYYETKPQIGISIDRDLAADLGVSVSVIGRTLETMMGTRRVTTFIERGREYDVILESEKSGKSSPLDITNSFVRSTRTGELVPLSSFVTLNEFADATTLNRYNRVRSITLQAGLAEGYSLDEALDYLEDVVRTDLPAGASFDYKGESLDLRESGSSIYIVFALALLVVYLALAGQFESFVHPFIIMLTVPMAVTGALLSLWATGQTLNIYSQIGLIILVGLSAKNGILIVEFINQLRDEGVAFRDAILEAASKRLRPILMTTATTIMGAVPLVLAAGAGAESRFVIGVVIIGGLSLSILLTIFVVPMMYRVLAKGTGSPNTVSQNLEKLLEQNAHRT
jgi:multidrug efflux pump